MTGRNLKNNLEGLYKKYNKEAFVHPDPLEFLYSYKDIRDREIIGLIASSLAYGRVAQILKSISTVTDIIGPSPSKFVESNTNKSFSKAFKGFKHRFADSNHLSALISGANKAIEKYGSLNGCFKAGLSPDDETVLPAMNFFVQ